VFAFTHPEYGIEMIKTKPETKQDAEQVEFYTVSHIEFEATSKDLVYAFDRFCKNNGQKNPYMTPSVFGSRFSNDLPMLKQGGWELVPGQSSTMYSRIVHGQRFLRLRHTVVK
jgi:DNA primase